MDNKKYSFKQRICLAITAVVTIFIGIPLSLMLGILILPFAIIMLCFFEVEELLTNVENYNFIRKWFIIMATFVDAMWLIFLVYMTINILKGI